MLFQQADQASNILLGPMGYAPLHSRYLGDGFVFFAYFVGQLYLIDDGGDGGDIWLNAGIVMAVILINSHEEDTACNILVWSSIS